MWKIIGPPILFTIISTLVFLLFPIRILDIIYVTLVVFLIIFAILRLFELIISNKHFHSIHINKYKLDKYLSITAIIPALLEAEKDIIFGTLKHFRQLSYPNFKVILAYNTYSDIKEIEKELNKLYKDYPNFQILKVKGSKTKAENINKALNLVDTDLVAIFDADHKPRRESLYIVNYYFQKKDVDIIQGRCISMADNHLLSKIVSVDYDLMYAINHHIRSIIYKFAIFGGSNGYWKTDIIKKLRFNKKMLTEDIDISVRAILKGFKIQYALEVISYELPPKDIYNFFKQRTRWAQGWLQATLKYSKEFIKSKYLNTWQKFGLLLIFPIRETRSYVLTQTISIAIAYGIKTAQWNWIDNKYFLTLVFLVVITSIEPLFILPVKNESISKKWVFLFSLFAPVYTYLLHSSTLTGLVRLLKRQHEFIVTKKG